MEKTSAYGIKTECTNGIVCIRTSPVYLSEEEFEDWVRNTRELIRKEKNQE
jgi:hypothetical protein